MGSIAARDCLRVLELTERVAAISLLATCQAVDLRGVDEASPRSLEIHARVRREIPMLEVDRRQDLDIEQVLALHDAGGVPHVGRGERLDISRRAESFDA